MALRSVAELLPAEFDELTLEHVPDLLVRAGEERETIFFERKSSVSNESLAKACAAFANTLGGLSWSGSQTTTMRSSGSRGVRRRHSSG